MKTLRLFTVCITLIFTLSCSSEDNDALNIAETTPRLGCRENTLSGPTALFWNVANGDAAPFTSIPMIPGPTTTFTHPFPGLNMSFDIPQGYTATPISEVNSRFGVDVRRSNNDVQNKVLYRYYPVVSFPTTNLDQIRAFFINDFMVNEYGFIDIPDVECLFNHPTVNFGGVSRTLNTRALRFGNIRAIVTVAMVPTPFGSTASVVVAAGPVNEYDNLVMNVFFPITFRLLLPDRESLSDRDNDGVPDVFDIAPDNPNVS